jgi:hypothetical protein
MKQIRACVEKVGRRLIYATDYTKCDHSTEEARNICFHIPKSEKIEGKYTYLKEGNTIILDYEKEKNISGLPPMIVGVTKITVVSKSPDVDFLLDL